ncbi:6-bladed beta-propeller [Litoreibacter albidus]|uniref:6-bladed beta-propeller n=1 Tax=Litoreibacter albidus TaxID=670155 RepID=UPI0037365DB4
MPDQIVGLGARFYRVMESQRDWAQGIDFSGISDVTVFNGAVVALLRRSTELLVLSPNGALVRKVSLRDVVLGHGIRALGADLMAVTDVDGHQVLLLDAEFNECHRLHCGNRPALGRPFNHPTDCARDEHGRIFVTDGYGNSQLHVFNPDFTHSHSIGGAGAGEGQFTTPHAVAVLNDGRIAVADRENNRVQIFGANGDYLSSITGLHKPMALEVMGDKLLVTDQTPRLSIYDRDGVLIGRCRTFATYGHGGAVAEDGSIFIANMGPDGLTKLEPLPL